MLLKEVKQRSMTLWDEVVVISIKIIIALKARVTLPYAMKIKVYAGT